MPIFRIVYIDDETFRPRTLTAAFPDRVAAEMAMAKHGHRVAHMIEIGEGEAASEPITVAMPPATADSPAWEQGARRSIAETVLGVARYDLAAMAVVAVGAAMAGAAIWLL